MTIKMIECLMNIAIAEKSKATVNLNIYLQNPTAVGEHPDLVSEADKLVEAISAADGKIAVLNGMVAEIKAATTSETPTT
jgi:hypothetical protein